MSCHPASQMLAVGSLAASLSAREPRAPRGAVPAPDTAVRRQAGPPPPLAPAATASPPCATGTAGARSRHPHEASRGPGHGHTPAAQQSRVRATAGPERLPQLHAAGGMGPSSREGQGPPGKGRGCRSPACTCRCPPSGEGEQRPDRCRVYFYSRRRLCVVAAASAGHGTSARPDQPLAGPGADGRLVETPRPDSESGRQRGDRAH